MPDENREVITWVENTVTLPSCCPASGNPRPGSALSIRYKSAGRTLEVFSLQAFVEDFVGGHPDGTRNMEAMIQNITAACALTLGTPVRVQARLLLNNDQKMTLRCRAQPLPPPTPQKADSHDPE